METNVETYPKCKHCDCEIQYTEQVSCDYDDAYYFVNWAGMCPQCQRTYCFRETFQLVERRFLDD